MVNEDNFKAHHLLYNKIMEPYISLERIYGNCGLTNMMEETGLQCKGDKYITPVK